MILNSPKHHISLPINADRLNWTDSVFSCLLKAIIEWSFECNFHKIFKNLKNALTANSFTT